MSTIIFYGAGQNARETFQKWYDSGLIPVCFVDRKTELHHTTFDTVACGSYDILPLIEAVAKYPDYVFYLTMIERALGEVTEYLFSLGIPKERIKYFTPPKPMYCFAYLTHHFYSVDNHKDGLVYYKPCCGLFYQQHRFISTGDYGKDCKHLYEYIEQLKELHKTHYNRCQGCSLLKPIPENGLPEIEKNYIFDFSTGGIKDGDLCNLRCVYCGYPHIHRTKAMEAAKFTKNGKQYDLKECFDFIEKNFKDKKVEISYCAAELGAQKMHNEYVLDIWNRCGFGGEIATNCKVYLPGIAELLKKNLISILTSPDSGCRETFHKIKSSDAFDEVWDTLRKYAQTKGGQLKIKYICLEEINDNYEEIDKFLDLVAELDAVHPNVVVLLSRNIKKVGKLNAVELDIFRYIVSRCKEINLKCRVQPQTFSQANIDLIYQVDKEKS